MPTQCINRIAHVTKPGISRRPQTTSVSRSLLVLLLRRRLISTEISGAGSLLKLSHELAVIVVEHRIRSQARASAALVGKRIGFSRSDHHLDKVFVRSHGEDHLHEALAVGP